MITAALHKRERRLLRLDEAAARLSVHRGTLHRWAREGRVPVVQFGGPGAALRFDVDALDRWIDEHARDGSA
jgi:excisionase family DNA binding protein